MHSRMRLSEQLRAQVGDYSPQTGALLVRQKKVRKAPATRYVPLTPIGVQAYNCLAAGRKPGQPLCINLDGSPLTEARYWFEPALEEACIKDLTWHCLRHTFASRAVMSGVPIAAVSKYLGHSTINQTMIYAHLQPDNAAQTVAALMKYYSPAQADTNSKTGTKTGTSTLEENFPQI